MSTERERTLWVAGLIAGTMLRQDHFDSILPTTGADGIYTGEIQFRYGEHSMVLTVRDATALHEYEQCCPGVDHCKHCPAREQDHPTAPGLWVH